MIEENEYAKSIFTAKTIKTTEVARSRRNMHHNDFDFTVCKLSMYVLSCQTRKLCNVYPGK